MALFAEPDAEEGARPLAAGPPGLSPEAGAAARALYRLRLWWLRPQAARRGGWLLGAPVALGAGIGLWFVLPNEPGVFVYAGGAVALILGALLFWRGWRAGRVGMAGCGFAVTLLALGFELAGLRAHALAAPVLGFRYYGPVEGRVIALDRSSRDRLRLTLDQLVLRDLAPERRPARLRVALERPELAAGVVPGQRVMLTALVSPPAGPAEPGGYDFRRNAWFDRLGAVGFARTPVMTVAPPDPGDRLLAGHRLRMRLSAAMQAAMPGQPGAVAAALMTGDRSGISEATNAAMRAANLYHIVSISGLHMGMLTGFVFAMLRYGLALAGPLALYWPAKKIAALVALAAASLYLWISGAEVATERAYVMVAVMLLAVLADRRAISLRSVALAALVILLRAPESLVSPGFQMSFAATVALILIYPPAARLVAGWPALLRPPALLVLSSLAAGLSTAPIAAAHFHRMAEYGLIANLAAVPVMGMVVMPAGVIAALLAPFGLAAPALWLMAEGTRWMIFVATTVAGWSGAVRVVSVPGPVVLPLLALGALIVILAQGRRLVQAAGVLACLTAFFLWRGAERPMVLIAETGELVGAMTPGGRALSKTGAAFVAESWLEADGDGATAGVAAARAGFSGPKGQRHINLAGWDIWHLTGKSAPAHLAEICRPGALVVLAAALTAAEREGASLLTPHTGGGAAVRTEEGAGRVPGADLLQDLAEAEAGVAQGALGDRAEAVPRNPGRPRGVVRETAAGPVRLRAGCLVYDQMQLSRSGSVALWLPEAAKAAEPVRLSQRAEPKEARNPSGAVVRHGAPSGDRGEAPAVVQAGGGGAGPFAPGGLGAAKDLSPAGGFGGTEAVLAAFSSADDQVAQLAVPRDAELVPVASAPRGDGTFALGAIRYGAAWETTTGARGHLPGGARRETGGDGDPSGALRMAEGGGGQAAAGADARADVDAVKVAPASDRVAEAGEARDGSLGPRPAAGRVTERVDDIGEPAAPADLIAVHAADVFNRLWTGAAR